MKLELESKVDLMQEILRKYTRVKADDLINLLGFPKVDHSTRRAITRIRDMLWERGVLVLSDKDGYFIPKEPEEIEAYMASYKKRALTALRKLSALQKLAYRRETNKQEGALTYESILKALGGADETKDIGTKEG